MRKLITLVMVVLLAMLSACTTATEAPSAAEATQAPEQPAAPAGKPIIAVCLPALDNPLMLGFQDAFKGAFGADYDVQVASADGNAVTQSTQVENFTAMKVKFMFVMPVEVDQPGSQTDCGSSGWGYGVGCGRGPRRPTGV